MGWGGKPILVGDMGGGKFSGQQGDKIFSRMHKKPTFPLFFIENGQIFFFRILSDFNESF